MKTIMVLGAHRSGSSLTAGLLHLAGVNMGGELIGPGATNAKGHFENIWFVLLNDRILSAAGGSWRELPLEAEIMRVGPWFREEISSTIQLESSELWGMKDPRFCLTHKLYLSHLVNPQFVICKRDHKSIIGSLERRIATDPYHHNLPIANPKNMVAEHYRRIEPLALSYPCLVVEYEQYFVNPEEQIQKLVDFIGVKADLNRLLSFVEPSLNHSDCT